MARSIPAILKRISCLVTLLLFGISGAAAQETEPIGGPYEADDETILLLHFDDDLTNAAGRTADLQHPDHASFSFIQDPRMADLGTQLRVDNDSRSDSTWFFIPDTTTLDLTGSWTMELWVNVFTFGDTNDDWRWQPRIMFKPGEPFYQSNYYITMWGGPRHFKTGYYTESGDRWQQIQSPDESMIPGKWYHITFIRDTTRQVIVQMLHDVNRELIHFESESYDPITGAPPRVNDNPLFIASYPQRDNFFLDGFIDELRISKVVRNFAVPPIIADVTELGNQPSGDAADINASIATLGDATIESATLHYRVNGGAFTEVALAVAGEELYGGQIPGQNLGDVVEYYVSAKTNTGLRATTPALAESDEPVLFEYAVWEPETQTLELTFDDPAKGAVDASQYGNEVELVGNPQFEAGVGGEGNALFMEGDSTFLEVESPFLASPQFTVDFWFFAQDSIPPSGTRLLVKENSSPWWQINYQIWFDAGGVVVPASFVPGQEGSEFIGGALTLDSTITADTWYHMVYVMEEDTAYAQLRDIDNNIIDTKGVAITGQDGANMADGPFRIGASSNGQFFRGRVDSVRVYNYALSDFKTATSTDNEELPDAISLAQNYPNPFNPVTTITYALPHAERVTLKVYDVLGREVATLVDGMVSAGSHRVYFEPHGIASGTYFYQLKTENTTKTRTMLLVK